MKTNQSNRLARTGAAFAMAVAWTAFLPDSNAELIHDADHYVLKAQHGQQWAADDKAVDAKLAEFKTRRTAVSRPIFSTSSSMT